MFNRGVGVEIFDSGYYSFNNKGNYHSLHNNPAVVNKHTGVEIWYNDGVLHRDDGPAIIKNNKYYYWYINGKHITSDVKEWIKDNNISYPFSDNELIEFRLRFL